MPSTIPSTDVKSGKDTLVRELRGIKFAGTGSCAAENRVANEDLATLGYDSEWIIQRTGILARHHVSPGQATSDLAIAAAQRALQDAGMSASEIDFIFVATMTSDHYTPSSAALVQAALGCQCPAMDMNAACSGFMYALITACQFIKNRCCRNVLVIGADVMSMVVDPQDKKTYPLFGDGAGATVLSADVAGSGIGSRGILSYRLASEGDMAGLLVVPGGGSRMPPTKEMVEGRKQYLKMDGQPVFKWAVRLIPEVTYELLENTQLNLTDIDLFIFHQANRRILDAVVEQLEIPSEKVFMNLDEYGNTSAASIPISLDESIRQGRIQPGNRVLLCGFGAGLSWGGCIVQF